MKACAWAMSIILSVCTPVFAAEAPPAQPDGRWTIKADNREAVKRWQQQRNEAASLVKYADKLLGDTPAMLTVRNNGGGPALLAFSKDVNRTADELDKLGPPFTSPFSYCMGVGAQLSLFWQAALGGSPKAELERIMNSYQQSRTDCVEQIQESPELKYTVSGPKEEADTLPEGCLVILDLSGTEPADMGTWTCPAAAFE